MILAPRLNVIDDFNIIIQNLAQRSFSRLNQFGSTDDRRFMCEILCDSPFEPAGRVGGFVNVDQGTCRGDVRPDRFLREDVFARFECTLDDLGLSEDRESDDDGVNVIAG